MLGERRGGGLPLEVPPVLPVFPVRAHRCAGSNVNSLTLIDPGIWVDLSVVPAVGTWTKKDLILHEVTRGPSFYVSLALLLMTCFNFSSSETSAPLAYSLHYGGDERGTPECHNASALLKRPRGISGAHRPELAYVISHLCLLSFRGRCSHSIYLSTAEGLRSFSFFLVSVSAFVCPLLSVKPSLLGLSEYV